MKALGIALMAIACACILVGRICCGVEARATEEAAFCWHMAGKAGTDLDYNHWVNSAQKNEARASTVHGFSFTFLPPLSGTEIFVYCLAVAGVFALANAAEHERRRRPSAATAAAAPQSPRVATMSPPGPAAWTAGDASPGVADGHPQGMRDAIRDGVRTGLGWAAKGDAATSDKSRSAALLLCLLLGALGAHRFYVGKRASGTLQLVTLGGFGIWSLIDLIEIVSGSFSDDRGRPLRA